MSAEVESMFYVRTTPWHGLGTRVEEALSAEEALEKSGLNWSVLQKEIRTDDGVKISGYQANIRDIDGKVLGVVSDRYRVVQNKEAFEFTNTLLGEGVSYETAGSLFEGKKIWILARLPEKYAFAGDEITPYLVFSSSHDGTNGIKVAMTPIRVVCNNTLNLALSTAQRIWSTKHTGDMDQKLYDAKNTLFMAQDYMDSKTTTKNNHIILKLQYIILIHNKRSICMQFEIDKDKLTRFIKSGIIVLSLILVLAAGVYYVPQIIAKASSSSKKLPIYCVDCKEKKVALSFDAAWGNEDTARILEILKKNEVKVTFFMTGGWVEKYPDDVKAIAAAGHDLGNHSENHKQMSKLSAEQCTKEIMDVHDKVKALTGVDMTLFRPPYGDYNNCLIETTKSCGYHCIQWDVDSLDWKDYGADCIVKKVVEHKHLGNGSIILCHNGAKFTADALEAMIKGLKEKGYEIVPISQLIYTDNYEMDHEGRQHQK